MYYYIDVKQAKLGRVLLLEKSETRITDLDSRYGAGVAVELIADSLPFGVKYDEATKTVRAATVEERRAAALKRLYAGIGLLGKVWTKDDFDLDTFVKRAGDSMTGTLNITAGVPIKIPHDSGIHVFRSDSQLAKIGRTKGTEIYLAENVTRSYIQSELSVAGNVNIAGVLNATGDVIGMSDRRIKKDFNNIQDPWNLVKRLNGLYYRLKEDNTRHIGLIAQDVEEVIPEAVYQDEKTGYKGIAYGNLGGLYVELFKDIDKRLNKLEYLLDKGGIK